MNVAGDIGGTKTELGIFSGKAGPSFRLHRSWFIAPITPA